MPTGTDTDLAPAPAPVEEERADTILVELGPGFRDRIFHEYDSRHPTTNNEVLVVAGRVVEVYPTARVTHALGMKILKQSKAKAATPTVDVSDIINEMRIVAPVAAPPAAGMVPLEVVVGLQAQIAAMQAEMTQLRASQAALALPTPSATKAATSTPTPATSTPRVTTPAKQTPPLVPNKTTTIS